MIKLEAPNLKITASSSSKEVVKSLEILKSFVNSVPVIIKELAERSTEAAIEIAPFSKDTTYDEYNNSYYKLGSRNYPLKQMINYQDDGDYGFTLLTEPVSQRDDIKATMQEFGYPYRTKWGPYPPNPKRSRRYAGTKTGHIKGLGYLRIATIYASSSLYSDKIDYFKRYTPADVSNYQAIVEKNLRNTLSRLATGFATGKLNRLPRWYSSKVKLPTQTVSKFTSKFGEFNVKINLPVDTYVRNNIINSGALKGVSSSTSGRPFAPRRRFLLDL